MDWNLTGDPWNMNRTGSQLPVLALVFPVFGLLLAIAGCATPSPTRRVETHLGRNARVLVNDVEIARAPDGSIAVPLDTGHDVIRVEEPRKPALVEDLRVLCDAAPEIEDRVTEASCVNTVLVHAGERGAITRAPRPVSVWRDPLEYVGTASEPFFAPAEGEGVVLVVLDRQIDLSTWSGPADDFGIVASAGPRTVTLTCERTIVSPVEVRFAATPPLTIALEPGRYPLRVAARGFEACEAMVDVHAREWTVLGVRLGPEAALRPMPFSGTPASGASR
jgi:hypothetical protein